MARDYPFLTGRLGIRLRASAGRGSPTIGFHIECTGGGGYLGHRASKDDAEKAGVAVVDADRLR